MWTPTGFTNKLRDGKEWGRVMKNMMSDTKVMEVPIHFSIQAAEHLEEIFPLKIKCSSELTIESFWYTAVFFVPAVATFVPRIVLPQKPWIFNKLFNFFSKYKNYFLTLFLAFSLYHHLRLNNIINPLFYLYEHKKYVFWTVLCNYVQALPACLLASAKCHNIT